MKKSVIKLASVILCIVILIFAVGCGDTGEIKLVSGATLADSTYKLGDYMGDYTLTDINGNTYTFSEVLKEKKAIILNFWFLDCNPCMMEFPYMQKAYSEYSDSIEIFAINIVDKKENSIKKRVNELELTLPVVMGDEAWFDAMQITAYPTTVVIDRYGCIAYSHTGSITTNGVFEKIFEKFTADDYEQKTFRNFSEIEQQN